MELSSKLIPRKFGSTEVPVGGEDGNEIEIFVAEAARYLRERQKVRRASGSMESVAKEAKAQR